MVALALQTPFTENRNDWLSVALPRSAETCYALFCDVARIPEWLNVIRSAVIHERDRQGRPRRVAFMASLRRASVGYSLTYRYRATDLRVAWSTSPRASIKVAGFAQFQPLTDKSCLMTYYLDSDLGAHGLPEFDDGFYAAHASSATIGDFRDFVLRTT